jgi:hypothetical protein
MDGPGQASWPALMSMVASQIASQMMLFSEARLADFELTSKLTESPRIFNALYSVQVKIRMSHVTCYVL